MTTQEIEQWVRRFVAEAYGVDQASLTLDTDFGIDLDDSLRLVEVLVRCEEASGIDVPDQDAASIQTLGALVEYLARRISGKAP